MLLRGMKPTSFLLVCCEFLGVEKHAEAIKEAWNAAERYDTLLFLSHLIVTSGSFTAGLTIDARLHVLHKAAAKSCNEEYPHRSCSWA